jgi:bacteriocin-like protein
MSEEKQSHENELDDAELDQISGGLGLQVTTTEARGAQTRTIVGGFKSMSGMDSETEVIE